jgi:hydrogenase nickel incorporation protein HypA/HybF
MHEYSIMSQIVQTITIESERNNLQKVSKITLDVGKLSFLGEESLRFCFNTISKGTILNDSELVINLIEPEVECQNCEFNGDLEYLDTEEVHFRIPKFNCPKCGGPIKVIKGKDCILREITGEVAETDESNESEIKDTNKQQ